MAEGGDSLEENFVLDSDSSTSECSDSSFELSQSEIKNDSQEGDKPQDSSISTDDGTEFKHNPIAKKPKLNWREGALRSLGDESSQLGLLGAAVTAFSRFFPNDALCQDGLEFSSLRFLDCSSFTAKSDRSVSDLLEFIRKEGFLNICAEKSKPLEAIVITGSATRAMYIVKELRELDSALAPLPLFFHGGGKKKEQASSHAAILHGKKCSVAVCLPSRLKHAFEKGLIDCSQIKLVLIDLKANEKRLNVLSQKETLYDFLSLFKAHILPNIHENMAIALV
jgi:hypothetical protein